MANKKQAVLIELLSQHARRGEPANEAAESASSAVPSPGAAGSAGHSSAPPSRAASVRPNSGASLAVPSYYRRPGAVPARRFGEADSRTGLSDSMETAALGTTGPDSSAVGLPSPTDGPARASSSVSTNSSATPRGPDANRMSGAYRALSNSAIHAPVAGAGLAPVSSAPSSFPTSAASTGTYPALSPASPPASPPASSTAASSSAANRSAPRPPSRVLVPPTVAPPAASVSVSEIRRRTVLRDEASFVEAGAVPPPAEFELGSTGWSRTRDWLSAAGGRFWQQTCRVAGQTSEAVSSAWASWAGPEASASPSPASPTASSVRDPLPTLALPSDEPERVEFAESVPARAAATASSDADSDDNDPNAAPIFAVVGDRVQLSLSLSSVGIALFCLALLCATCYLLGRGPGSARRAEPSTPGNNSGHGSGSSPNNSPVSGDAPSPLWKPVPPSSSGTPGSPSGASSAAPTTGGGVSSAPGAVIDPAVIDPAVIDPAVTDSAVAEPPQQLIEQLAAERPAREAGLHYVVLLAVPDNQPDGLDRLRHLQKWLLQQHEFETSVEAVYKHHWSLVSVAGVAAADSEEAVALRAQAESLIREYRDEAERPAEPSKTRLGPWLRRYPWTK